MSVINLSNFKEIKETYLLQQKYLTQTQRERFELTLDNMQKIHANFSNLQETASDDKLRNSKISLLTNSNVEDGFSASGKLLSERINLFIMTYLLAKEQGKLKDFFACFAKGDPCLNGRMECLNKFAASLSGFDVESDPETGLYLPSGVVADIIMQNFTDEYDAHTLSPELVSNFMSKNKELIRNLFKKHTRYQLSFLDYLKSRQIIFEKLALEEIYETKNWEKILAHLIDWSTFHAIYGQALTYLI